MSIFGKVLFYQFSVFLLQYTVIDINFLSNEVNLMFILGDIFLIVLHKLSILEQTFFKISPWIRWYLLAISFQLWMITKLVLLKKTNCHTSIYMHNSTKGSFQTILLELAFSNACLLVIKLASITVNAHFYKSAKAIKLVILIHLANSNINEVSLILNMV